LRREKTNTAVTKMEELFADRDWPTTQKLQSSMLHDDALHQEHIPRHTWTMFSFPVMLGLNCRLGEGVGYLCRWLGDRWVVRTCSLQGAKRIGKRNVLGRGRRSTIPEHGGVGGGEKSADDAISHHSLLPSILLNLRLKERQPLQPLRYMSYGKSCLSRPQLRRI